MATIKLPTRSDFKRYSFKSNLDGRLFELGFEFNERSDRWQMSISDSGGNLIVGGVPLLTNRIPNLPFSNKSELPPGAFFVLDETNKGTNPGVNSLGNTHNLYYQEIDT